MGDVSVLFIITLDILASGHEEAVFAAMEALKGLMHSCIDKSLVEHGISQIKARLQGLRAAPTVIEKICAILESFLGFQYNDVWDLSFHVLSSGFDILGKFHFCCLLPLAF